MKKIDDQLGGTTPLNVFKISCKILKDDDEFSEWDEDNENEGDKAKYWFTRDKMDKILKVMTIWMIPEIGKFYRSGNIKDDDLNKELRFRNCSVV